MTTPKTLDWKTVCFVAHKFGSKFPELVAAQWALESGWGKSTSGRNNYFGLKGPGSKVPTTEYVNGVQTPVEDEFLDFDTFEDCVALLIKLWYKDYTNPQGKSFKGVNNAATIEEAARRLVAEGYATDPRYVDKVLDILKREQGKWKPPAAVKPPSTGKPPAAVKQPVLFTIKALQATFLKKSQDPAVTLPDNKKVAVEVGRTYGVVKLTELAHSAHAELELASGAGTWFVYLPHWQTIQKAAPVVAAQPAGPINWSDFNARITPNLTVGEVLQWDKRRIPPAGSAVPGRILKAATQFQRIRDAWGRPLGVTSWYRPEPINRQVGGVPGSQHTLGTAFDIYTYEGSLESFYQWLRVRWSGALGDGRHLGFIHLDLRGDGVFMPGGGATNWTWWTY
jgi:hypothetical protein